VDRFQDLLCVDHVGQMRYLLCEDHPCMGDVLRRLALQDVVRLSVFLVLCFLP
jgi:hypothetical protein